MSPSLTFAQLESISDQVADTETGSLKPVWYDEEKFKRGQAFYKKHVTGVLLSWQCFMVTLLNLRGVLDAIVFTEKSDTREKAFVRYFITFYHIQGWMEGDLWDKTSQACRSISIVRAMHRNVARKMNETMTDKVYKIEQPRNKKKKRF